MTVVITPSGLSGTIKAISSKSDAHRRVIAAALADRPTVIKVESLCEDLDATLACVAALGGKTEKRARSVTVFPVNNIALHSRLPSLDCGESGTTARFMLPVAAAVTDGFRMTGRGRLPERPFSPLIRAMRENGCAFSGESLPFSVSGRLCPGAFTLPGDVSSQFISGLLFALPLLPGESRIILTSPLESAGYVRMTLSVLESFGIVINCKDNIFTIPDRQRYLSPGETEAEGDWSNAAFWLAAGAISGDVAVDGLNAASLQGDRAIAELLGAFGARVSAGNSRVTVSRNTLSGTAIDAAQIPDLVPVLAVLGAAAEGETVIKNAARLRIKESDRLCALARNLRELGAEVRETEDGLVIRGGKPLTGGAVSGFNDHRIVMAFAVFSALCAGPVTISGAEAVSKSYPSFFEDFKKLGGKFDVV